MNNIGTITEITDSTVKIKIVRDSACGGNCQSCTGCELKDHFITADLTDLDFTPQVGNCVNIFLDNKTFYAYTVSGYAVFVILLIAGAVSGYMKFKTEDASVLGAFLGLAIGFLALKLIFKNKKSAYTERKTTILNLKPS